MIREIVFDTETTGLYVEKGDRLVDIGAVELVNHLPTGREYHQYINPERSVPADVVAVHGLTEEFLRDFPTFSEIAKDFIDFVGDDGVLVAHNAPFDMGFLNYQLKECGYEPYPNDRVIDTLAIARKMFPGAKNKLDALCKRFKIDNSNRVLHGALIDADLLAKVYLEMLGGYEPSMVLNNSKSCNNHVDVEFSGIENDRIFHEARLFSLSEEEEEAHREFLETKIKNPIWLSDELKSSNN